MTKIKKSKTKTKVKPKSIPIKVSINKKPLKKSKTMKNNKTIDLKKEYEKMKLEKEKLEKEKLVLEKKIKTIKTEKTEDSLIDIEKEEEDEGEDEEKTEEENFFEESDSKETIEETEDPFASLEDSLPELNKPYKSPLSLSSSLNNLNQNNIPNKIIEKNTLKPAKSINIPKDIDDKPREVGMYKKIAYSFVFLTIILVAVVFYFTFVKLNITITPNSEHITDNLIIDIYNREQGSKVSLSKEVVPGIVEEIKTEETKKYPTSGTKIIGEEVNGKITIINNYTKNQPLVATTRVLSSDNKLFRIKNTINIPAKGSLEVEVYADNPTSAMAIGPTKFTIPGLWAGLQDKIYAESKTKFIYGQKVKKYVQKIDIENGINNLKEVLIEKVKNQIGKEYKGYDKIIHEILDNTIEIDIDSKTGQETKELKINMKASASVVAFSTKQVNDMVQAKLIKSLNNTKELVSFGQSKIVYNLSNYNIEQGTATIDVRFEGQVAPKQGAEILDKKKITNLKLNQLKDYLGSFSEIKSYEIVFFPSFLPKFLQKVPYLVDRINIEIKN